MVFNANFINISVISWQSVLLVEETGEKHHNLKPEILRFSWNNHGNFEQIDTANALMHDCSISWFNTNILINSGGVKLVLCVLTVLFLFQNWICWGI
jgi:hypothetical protein